MTDRQPSALEFILARQRAAVLARDADTLQRLTDAYRPIRARLVASIEALTAEIAGMMEPTSSQVLRLTRAQMLFDQVDREYRRLSSFSEAVVTRGQREVILLGLDQPQVLAAVATGNQAAAVHVMTAWHRVPTAAVEELVGRLSNGSPVRLLFDALGPEVSAIIRAELEQGIALGTNPNAIGRRIVDRVTGITMNKATQFARDALLSSHQAASDRNALANRDILEPYKIWISALQEGRTCLACASNHGSRWPLEATMPRHSRCRCTWIYPVKGVDMGIPTGQEWFDGLSDAGKRRWGNAAHEAVEAGARLDDFVVTRQSRVWGDSVSEGSAYDARRRAENRGRRAA